MRISKIILVIFLLAIAYIYYIQSPTTRENDIVEFSVARGQAYSTIAPILKEEKVIKSEIIFKAYVRLYNPKPLQACTYQIDRSWKIYDIVEELEKGCNFSDETISVTIPEGRTLLQTAEIISNKINSTKEEIIEVWTSDTFLDEVIEKYDYISDDIKNPRIKYPLEGYLFPSTYELLNEDVTPKYVAFKMLDQMKLVYDKNKDLIEETDFSFHEVLTFASIVEYEGILDEDRPIIAGVFYNRLEKNWRLESCATLGYAIDNWKSQYTFDDMAVDHPYNTYLYGGLPPGPGGSPSEKSIEAVLKPTETNYMFFLANVCDSTDNKTYFSETLAEHNAKGRQFNFRCN